VLDGDVSTGADDDARRATELAVTRVTESGTDLRVGHGTIHLDP
jgi:hypothetical protein